MGILNRIRKKVWAMIAKLGWLPPLIARCTLGWVFLESGWGKLHHLDKVIDFFSSLGIPFPNLQAPFVASVELVGGALVLLGLWAREAAVFLIGVMAVAIWTAKRGDLSDVSDLFALSEYLYAVLLFWIAVQGPGAASIDHWME